MVHTPIIQKAIQFAIKVHELDAQQKRKATQIPYITHPLTVGMILSRVTHDENIIAAGILHDTIEDCEPYHSITKTTLENEFNKDVARMVDDVTEQDKTLPWMERKKIAFSHIKDMRHDSLLVKSADVLHNLSDLNESIKQLGIRVFDRFNASKAYTILRYQKIIQEIERVWPENPLLPDLKAGLKILLNKSSKEEEEIITLPNGKRVLKSLHELGQSMVSGMVKNLNEQTKKEKLPKQYTKEPREIITLPDGQKVYKDLHERNKLLISSMVKNLNEQTKEK